MKKLLNDPDSFVDESLGGFLAEHSELLEPLPGHRVVLRRENPLPGTVAVISGGGSGHEPMHIGFVGPGMLTAAVPGAIFSAPPAAAIVAAARGCHAGGGVLFIVGNYTGDVLNFEAAAEDCRRLGLDTEILVVADDIGLGDRLPVEMRRGIAGTILVEKLLGAAAERGDELADVLALGRRILPRLATIGAAWRGCVSPDSGALSFRLEDSEMEIGVGIHGERGRERLRRESADDLAVRLVAHLLAELEPVAGTRVLLLVNGLGTTPPAELSLFYGAVRARLEAADLVVAQSLVGTFVTVLDMAGVSVSILLLDAESEALWRAPVHTAALRKGM